MSVCVNLGLAARIVDELDEVVLVLARLQPQLDVALDGVGEEVVVGAQAHDRLQARDAADEVVDALGDALHLVDERLVLGEAPDRALALVDALGDVVDVLERALEALAGVVERARRCRGSRPPPFGSPWFCATRTRTSSVMTRTFSRICCDLRLAAAP